MLFDPPLNTATQSPSEHRYPISSQTPLPDSQPSTVTRIPAKLQYPIRNRILIGWVAPCFPFQSICNMPTFSSIFSEVTGLGESSCLQGHWFMLRDIQLYVPSFKRYVTCLLSFKFFEDHSPSSGIKRHSSSARAHLHSVSPLLANDVSHAYFLLIF